MFCPRIIAVHYGRVVRVLDSRSRGREFNPTLDHFLIFFLHENYILHLSTLNFLLEKLICVFFDSKTNEKNCKSTFLEKKMFEKKSAQGQNLGPLAYETYAIPQDHGDLSGKAAKIFQYKNVLQFRGTTCQTLSHPRFKIPMQRAFIICGRFFWDSLFHKIRLGRTV